ncbi:MAG: hypothetical protein ACI8Y4_001585 [Candidatus Poriferisodalaceae bacterium]|jgi:hypothetical protein
MTPGHGGDAPASIAVTPCGRGYWTFAEQWTAWPFGDAQFHGSTGNMGIDNVIGMIPVADGDGYWVVGADGSVFSFGPAEFFGSVPGALPGVQLNKPVIGGVAFGRGYLLFAADGGVFTFSDLPFQRSLGAVRLPADIISVAAFN